MAVAGNQINTSSSENTPMGRPNTATKPAEALHRLMEVMQECMRYEGLVTDAANNANLVAQLRIDNEKLGREVEKCNESINRVLEAHLVKVVELTKKIDKLSKDNSELDEKEEHLTLENKRLQESNEKLADRFKSVNNDLQQRLQDIGSFRDKLQRKEKDVVNLEKVLQQENNRWVFLSKEHETTSKECGDYKNKLQASQQELRKWEGFRSVLRSETLASLSNKINALCQQTHGLVEKFFKTELPKAFFENQRENALLDAVRCYPTLKGITFVPPSNSAIAKDFRMSTALAILSNLLMEHIFSPTYVHRHHVIHDLLSEKAEMDNTEESLCRALMLSLSESGADRFGGGPQHFMETAGLWLGLMLPASDLDSFNSDLRSLTSKAMTLWDEIQHNTCRIEATLSEDGYNNWRSLLPGTDIYESASQDRSSTTDLSSDAMAFALFPAFLTVTVSSGREVFYEGFGVRESQVAAAEKEWRGSMAGLEQSLVKRNVSSRRGRKTSDVNGHSSFLKGSQNFWARNP